MSHYKNRVYLHRKTARRPTSITTEHITKPCYLGIKISKEGTLDEAISDINLQGRKATFFPHGTVFYGAKPLQKKIKIGFTNREKHSNI